MFDPGMVGYGSTVTIAIGGGDPVQVDGIYELTMPTPTITNPQAPSMQLPNNAMQRIPGKVIDYGQTSFSLAWIPGSAADDLLQSLITLGTSFTVTETLPNGVGYTITGLFASMTPATPWDDRMTAAVTLDTSGAPTIGAAAAPVNSTLPGIAGTAQVGETLFAFPGVWSGAPAFTYQWNNEGVPINGATSQSYTLQATDEGDAITVTVTGTNSAGNASATSEATIDVIAA